MSNNHKPTTIKTTLTAETLFPVGTDESSGITKITHHIESTAEIDQPNPDGFAQSSNHEPLDDEGFDVDAWAKEQIPFALGFLTKRGFPLHEAGYICADCFSDPVWSTDPTEDLDIFQRSFLVFRLRQAMVNFIRYKLAGKREGSRPHVSTDEAEGWEPASSVDSRTFAFGADDIRLRKMQLKKIEGHCNPGQELVRKVMLRGLYFCRTDIEHPCDLFTAEERVEFMGREVFTYRTFRQKVNRVRREVKQLIDKAHGKQDGFWLN